MDNLNDPAWKDCDCGCGGIELRLGPAYYWLRIEIGKNGLSDRFYLNTKHSGTGDHLGGFWSLARANEVACYHARPILERFHQELTLAEAYINRK